MTKHMKWLYFYLFLIIQFGLFSCESLFVTDPFPEVALPVFVAGYDIKKVINDPKGTKSVVYKVNIDYPAQEIINYYNREFKVIGLIPYSEDGYGIGQWENFNEKTGWEIANSSNFEKDISVAERFISTWIDNKREKRYSLYMRYRYNYNNPDWDKTVIVNCQVTSFFKLPIDEK